MSIVIPSTSRFRRCSWYASKHYSSTPTQPRFATASSDSSVPPTLARAVILDVGANERLDITSAEMLAQLLVTLRSAGIDLAIADARQPVIQMAQRSGLLDQLGQDHIFHTIDEAVQRAQRDNHPTVQPRH